MRTALTPFIAAVLAMAACVNTPTPQLPEIDAGGEGVATGPDG